MKSNVRNSVHDERCLRTFFYRATDQALRLKTDLTALTQPERAPETRAGVFFCFVQ